MNVSFLMILSLFSSIHVAAQQSSTVLKNYIGVGLGYSFDQIKDTNFSPLDQKGNSLVYSMFYERYSENILKIKIEYGNDFLKSGSLDDFNTSYYKGSLGITYLKNLSAIKNSTNIFIGGSYNMNVIYMDWNDQDAFSYTATNGLSVDLALSKLLGKKNYLETMVSIPILELLSRPPYNGIDENVIENQDEPLNLILDGKLVSFDKYKAIHWNIKYRYALSRYFNLRIDYTLTVQKVETVHEFTSLSNRFSTSILYNF